MPPFGPFRAPSLARFAVVATISAGMAGCSTDISRFSENPFTGSIAHTNVPPSDLTRSEQSAPAGRVESQPLAGSPNSLPAPPPVHRSSTGSPPRTAAAPARPAQTSGVHVAAPKETLISIARFYGKSRSEIARANGIKAESSVRVGQRLTIPGVGQSKIKTAANSPPAQKLGKPEGTLTPPKAAAAPEPKPAPAQAVAGTKQAALKPTEPVATARMATSVADAAAEASKGAAAATTGAVPTFRWPVRGRVITGYGAKTNGQQNDGINLAVPEGTSVKAAEDGIVAYAGNELKGYGNLLLVRHSNGYVTAYAHASELKVKRGETVKRGQIIALAGQTGTVNSPQLHFEIRKGSTPVDPMQYLSGN
jgi:murein DD-endopeptidase MepM/ murein hydrolase activator NlpD